MTARSVNIALVGAAGRMGLEITRVVASKEGASIRAAVEHAQSNQLGEELGTLAGVDAGGVIITSDLAAAISECDVVVDISLPSATSDVLRQVVSAQKPYVCGITGLDNDTLAAIDRASEEIPLLYTTNLSLGVAVLGALVQQAISTLSDWDIEIVEMHHRLKADAPSGTATSLANLAAQAAGFDPANDIIYGREGQTGVRPAHQIGVHAVRGGGVFGDHTVILADEHERIELTHRAHSRRLFAAGAVRAALFLHDKPKGRYQMADILGLKK